MIVHDCEMIYKSIWMGAEPREWVPYGIGVKHWGTDARVMLACTKRQGDDGHRPYKIGLYLHGAPR